MTIEEQFNLVAKQYDCNRRKFIPCFDDYYESTTDFLASGINNPKRILDLGAGTGLLTSFWYKHFPQAEYVLSDIADEMLNVARERFNGLENVKFKVMDYTRDLSEYDFDMIISALSIHHIENEQKEDLFKRIYEKLPEGGIFINYDQFSGGNDQINKWMDSYWENYIKNSGLPEGEAERWKERKKLDRECSLEDEIEMIKKNNFSLVKCVYSYQKFSVILCIK